MRQEQLNLLEALSSSRGLGTYFTDKSTWWPWFVFIKALIGQGTLSAREKTLLKDCTGLDAPPTKRIREAFLICGRRSGKSTFCALLAVFYAVWGEWKRYISLGERPKVFVVAVNMDQSKIILNYVKAILSLTPFLRSMVKKELADSIELKNGTEIVVKPASWRSSRGFTCGLLLLEELAFFRYESDSSLRDREIYTAIKPGMINIRNSLIIGISTPFSRQGLLFQKFKKHYGKDDRVLIWQAATWTMNPNLTERELREEELEALGIAEFNAEYGARFREDIEGYLPLQIIERAIIKGQTIVPAQKDLFYHAFCDSSEGLHHGGDSMTLAVVHKEREKVILDAVLEAIPPFDPGVVIQDIVELSKQYKIRTITQDRHAVAWIANDFKPHGIEVEISDKTKSQIYEHFAVAMNKNQVELLDNRRLKDQVINLQRFLRPGGMVKIDHISGQHDDIINAVAGAVTLAVLAEDERPFSASILEAINEPEGSKFDKLSEADQEQVRVFQKNSWLLDDVKKEKEDDDFEQTDEELFAELDAENMADIERENKEKPGKRRVRATVGCFPHNIEEDQRRINFSKGKRRRSWAKITSYPVRKIPRGFDSFLDLDE